MLIIQIALGIVLALIILALLPTIFKIGVWLSLATIVILMVGLGIYFFIENAGTIIAILTIILCGVGISILIGRYDDKSILEKEKKRRELLGYDD